jgi:hypothetical protein
MPFCQPLSALVEQQVAVVPGRRRESESPCQQNLPRRRLEQVGSANHFGDPHGRVVDHDRELIGGEVVSPPYQEVAKILTAYEALRAEVPIHEFDRLTLRDKKTPVSASWRIDTSQQGCGWATGSGINAFVIMRRLHGLRQVFARAAARVEPPPGVQAAPRVPVKTLPLALGIRLEGTTHIRPFLPLEPQPTQIFKHGLTKMLLRALRVKVLIAQDKNAARRDRPLLRQPKCTRVAEVQEAGGRGSQAAAVCANRENSRSLHQATLRRPEMEWIQPSLRD